MHTHTHIHTRDTHTQLLLATAADSPSAELSLPTIPSAPLPLHPLPSSLQVHELHRVNQQLSGRMSGLEREIEAGSSGWRLVQDTLERCGVNTWSEVQAGPDQVGEGGGHW